VHAEVGGYDRTPLSLARFMSSHPPPQCPACNRGTLVLNRHSLWACGSCSRALEVQRAVFDMRPERDPLAPRDLMETEAESAMLQALAALDLGTDWKTVLEELLLELESGAAEELMQLIREGRGAWAPLLSGKVGSALFIGDARSGTVVALARCGYSVTSVDSNLERLAFAGYRNRALTPKGSTRAMLSDPSHRLPFADRSFDLVVRETPFGEGEHRPTYPLEECRRVCADELIATANNRLGYKESSGKRGDFRVRTPLGFLRSALTNGKRPTLGQLRRHTVRDGFETSRAFSLYPHSADFTHIAALDEKAPELYVGPKERKNPLKILGYRAGLFPYLTPSFAVVTRRRENPMSKTRIERLLRNLAERLYVDCPRVEYLLATRGNNALVMTALPGRDEEDPTGRWIVRIPLHPIQQDRVQAEQTMLAKLERDFPSVPIPQPLFDGVIDGIFLTCERRLPGHSAAQFSGDPEAMARLYREAAQHFASMLVAPATELTESEFEELVSAKFELVVRHSGSPDAREAVERMHQLARERLIGRPMPRVLRHCDPRSKHIQIRPTGKILGYYDWGSSEAADFPLCDLLHLIVHERFHQGLPHVGAAWQLVRNSGEGLRPEELAPIEYYINRLNLHPDVRFAVEEIYPMLVGAMAEKNWDYSRPRWIQNSFRL